MIPINEIAELLNITTDEALAMTWPELMTARDRLVCDVLEAHEAEPS